MLFALIPTTICAMNSVSMRPNEERSPSSNFGFDQFLLAPIPLAQRLKECIARVISFFDSHTTSDAVTALGQFIRLTDTQRGTLFDTIAAIGHVGLLFPPETDVSMLLAIAADAKLMISGNDPSEIFARELGQLAGQQYIATRIYRMEGISRLGQPVGIEAFVPDATAVQVNGWIAEGVGTHLAFRMKSRSAVTKIPDLLRNCGGRIPLFMNGCPMENRNKGALVIYYDLPVNAAGRKFRIEFYHEP